MSIKIAHEASIPIISDIAKKTDYCYCLCHLMEKHENYCNYFLNARKLYDREILLDSGIFEMGKALDSDKYINWIQKINPNSFIAPDVLENATETIHNFENFMFTYEDDLPKDIRVIGAVQGKTWQDILSCYKFMADHADIIALSFDFSYYNITGEGATTEEKCDSGRQRLVEQLIDRGVWEWNKPHHMLGTMTAAGCSWFKQVNNIVSTDTSNPVIHGLHNIKYNSTFGLKTKIKTKMADLIETKPTDEQMDCIYYNIDMFRKIVNG